MPIQILRLPGWPADPAISKAPNDTYARPPLPSAAGGVVPPAPQGGVAAGRAGVRVAGGDGGPAGGRWGGDLMRPAHISGGADTKLPAIIPAPAPQGTVAAGGAAVLVAGGDAGPARGRLGDLLGQVLVYGCPGAQFPRCGGPPAPQGVALADAAGVAAARDDTDPPRGSSRRGGGVGGVPGRAGMAGAVPGGRRCGGDGQHASGQHCGTGEGTGCPAQPGGPGRERAAAFRCFRDMALFASFSWLGFMACGNRRPRPA